jgi:2-polyprenyl-3-methyl-5-hydroxy-6-metoxy-1,4-benzoquinol methylase
MSVTYDLIEKAGRYKPGQLGEDFVLPRPKGLKGLYLRLFGVPDVRVHLTACYLLKSLSELSFKSVLDVGCGNGMLTCLIASGYSDCDVVGVDRDKESVNFASRLAAQNDLHNVRFQPGNFESDQLTGSYDVITCLGVLQFIHDIPALLERFKELLVPGGHLLLQLPSTDSRELLMKASPLRRRLPEFGQARGGFSESEARALLTGAGFEIVQVRSIIKGPAILAKELFYISLSVHSRMAFAFCPLLNWITVRDDRYSGRGSGIFITAKKSPR